MEWAKRREKSISLDSMEAACKSKMEGGLGVKNIINMN